MSGGACAKRCPQGTVLANGLCVRAMSTAADGGGLPGESGGDAGVLTAQQAPVGSSTAGQQATAAHGGSMQQAGAGAAVDGAIGAAAGASGASTRDAAADDCQLAGTSRCSSDASKSSRVESCVGGKWSDALICASDEICLVVASDQATCSPRDSAVPTCNGIVCGGVCVPNDDKNCGSCGHDCTRLANLSGPASCDDGVCNYPESSCEPGFAHCSNNPDDGCETKLSDEKNCGACGVACPETEPVCAMSAAANGSSRSYACSTGCSAEAPVLCGMSCIDIMSDPQHCGACDTPCPPVANGQPVCQQGTCSQKCNANHHLCGHDCLSDRSTESCGTACGACQTPNGAQATCDGRTCGFICTNPRALLKCDDGCFPSDDRNCGACGNDCSANGTVCDGTRCVECRSSADCGGSERYCVRNECKACQPGDASTCGDCQECSSSGSCVSNGTARICYRDADGDGYGGKTSPQTVCGECPSGTVSNNMDCYDSGSDSKAGDVHPGQSAYFETGYGTGASKYDYDCNGREEKQALNPTSRQVQGQCTCNSSDMCVAPSMVATPCGQRGSECIGGANGCGTCGEPIASWVIQGCR